MKKRYTIMLIVLVISVVLIVCFAVNRINIQRIIDQHYLQSTYIIPSKTIVGDIYLDKNIEQNVDLDIIPVCLQDNEISHGIKFKKPIRIMICEDDKASGKIFKLYKTKASGFAFSDDLIVINYNNLYSLGYTFESIIRHESSHTLIKQNIRSFYQKILTFSNRSLWFSEGFALYNQGLVIYSQDEIRKSIVNYNIVYDSRSDNFKTDPQNLRLDYSLYYHFMDYLITKYGKDKLLEYLSLMIDNYALSEKSFEIVFDTTLCKEVLIFAKQILNKELL